MLSVVRLNVVILSVVAPKKGTKKASIHKHIPYSILG
jgi:hypothetical protein